MADYHVVFGKLYSCGGYRQLAYGDKCLCGARLVYVREWEEGPDGLTDFATMDATRTLADNWRCALADGSTIEQLLPDVEEVIVKLRNWAARVYQEVNGIAA